MFDLLLSDVVMPFMNGRNLAKEICARQPGIKVLFMSGYVGDADILADMQDSDMPFLEKPFTRSTLSRKVRETLG
jgi:DNA-binding NtrC family response regulator